MPRKRQPKKNRRARGTGSIFYDKRRSQWVFRKNKHEYRAATQEGAIEKADAVLPPAPKITLADWHTRWLESLDVRVQTKRIYTDQFKLRVLPALGHLPVAKITPFDIEEAWRKWGASVGALTVKHSLAALSTCLQAAVRARIISENPARVARKPAAEVAKQDIFAPDELKAILAACLADRKLHPLAVCAGTGVRIGEALGLLPTHYDASAGTLSVVRTLIARTNTFGPPKSKNGVRTIRVPKTLAPALARAPSTTRYQTYLARWILLLKTLDLRYRSLHQLRHSVASYLNAQGVPIADAARHLGHSVAEYVKTYVRPVGHDVGGVLEGLYGGAKVARTGTKGSKPKRAAKE